MSETQVPEENPPAQTEVSDGLQVIQRLMVGLREAEKLLTKNVESQYWLLWVTEGEVDLQAFDTTDQLKEKLIDLRRFEPKLYLFYGRRLRLMKKPYLAAIDGDQEIKLQEIVREFADTLPPPDPTPAETPAEAAPAPATAAESIYEAPGPSVSPSDSSDENET